MAKVELLAPAGNAETFGAALDAGADAIYVGAPGFNARNLSRDLRLEEIAAMIGNCRRLGKKLFVAANSLVLEDELPQVIELLALLRELRPDGLIVQDLGLLRLARRYFPELPLHASTLMFAHNHQAVRYLAELGCRRVVLARELTVKEIGAIAARRGDTEIEVFIHGAMCFSYSGLCLFSSYLGGKSGLRGRCVQPCRRGFGEVGRGRGDKEGGASRYLFSMNDLSALEILPELLDTGITSLKIEGRQRSATYVEKVVGAYRRVLDASPDNRDEAICAARVMIEQAMSRRLGSGYFLSPQPAEAISPYHSGNLGVHLGRFVAVKQAGGEQVCRFVTKSSLAVGDRLRLHREPSGERVAFRVKSLFAGSGPVRKAGSGERVSLALPPGFALGSDSHVEVYKVDGGDVGAATLPGIAEATAELAAIRRSRARAIREAQDSILPRVVPVSTNSSGQGSPGRAEKRQGSLEWWLKTDALKVVLDRTVTPDRYVLPMSTALLGQVAKIKNGLGKNMRSVVWALPPLLTEGEVVRCRRQLTVLLRSGFRLFQIGHLSQSGLFEGEKVNLYADYTCNLSNSQALAMAADLGLVGAQAAIELDKQALANLLTGVKLAGRPEQIWGVKRGLAVGLTVYGSPALFTSRLAPDHFHYQRSIRSPKNEDFVLRKIDGGSIVHGDKPFSLLPYQQELREAGLDYAVVDIVGTNANARFLEELRERLANSGRYGKLPTFNYLGKLL